MVNPKLLDPGIIAKHINSKDEIREDAGMFIVHYNPSEDLLSDGSWSPSCDYGVEVTKEDNLASALQKNQPYIKEFLDDMCAKTEGKEDQSVVVSPQVKLDDENAYCIVTYAGYDDEGNEGYVESLVSDQISHVIPNPIRMDWDRYPVPDSFIKQMNDTEGKIVELSMDDSDLSFSQEITDTI